MSSDPYLIRWHFKLDDDRFGKVRHLFISQTGWQDRAARSNSTSCWILHGVRRSARSFHFLDLFLGKTVLANLCSSIFRRKKLAVAVVNHNQRRIASAVGENRPRHRYTRIAIETGSVLGVVNGDAAMCGFYRHGNTTAIFRDHLCMHANVRCSFAEFTSLVNVILNNSYESIKKRTINIY